MNTFLKVLGIAALIGGGLVTGGVLPASLGVVFATLAGVAGAAHPSFAATQAFGKDAK